MRRLRCALGAHRWRVERVGLLRVDRCDWCRTSRRMPGRWPDER